MDATTLGSILELTDEVQTAIDAGEWQRASELEAERRAQLERLVAEHGRSAEVVPTLTVLEQRNYQLIGLVEHHKRRVLREAATVKTGHTAAAAYAAAGGTP